MAADYKAAAWFQAAHYLLCDFFLQFLGKISENQVAAEDKMKGFIRLLISYVLMQELHPLFETFL